MDKQTGRRKLERAQDFNALTASYHNKDQEKKFQEYNTKMKYWSILIKFWNLYIFRERNKNQQNHGKDFGKNLPPSFYYRYPLFPLENLSSWTLQNCLPNLKSWTERKRKTRNVGNCVCNWKTNTVKKISNRRPAVPNAVSTNSQTGPISTGTFLWI